jgi:hypothetical protein
VTRNAKKMDKDGRKCEATKVHPLIWFRAPLKDMPIKKKKKNMNNSRVRNRAMYPRYRMP